MVSLSPTFTNSCITARAEITIFLESIKFSFIYLRYHRFQRHNALALRRQQSMLKSINFKAGNRELFDRHIPDDVMNLCFYAIYFFIKFINT